MVYFERTIKGLPPLCLRIEHKVIERWSKRGRTTASVNKDEVSTECRRVANAFHANPVAPLGAEAAPLHRAQPWSEQE